MATMASNRTELSQVVKYTLAEVHLLAKCSLHAFPHKTERMYHRQSFNLFLSFFLFFFFFLPHGVNNRDVLWRILNCFVNSW